MMEASPAASAYGRSSRPSASGPRRPLPHRAATRRGRDGDRVRSAGPQARPQGRSQGSEARTRRGALAGDQPLFGYAITYARMGRVTEAREILARLQAYARGHYVNPMSIAAIYASLGDKDEAFAWLDRTIQDRTVFLFGIVTWPEFDPLRHDPRFVQLIKRIGLPRPSPPVSASGRARPRAFTHPRWAQDMLKLDAACPPSVPARVMVVVPTVVPTGALLAVASRQGAGREHCATVD